MAKKVKRLKKLHFDWHHRKPTSIGGGNDDRNMSHVSASKHQAWHTLFANKNVYEIADIINEKWLDNDYLLTVVRK